MLSLLSGLPFLELIFAANKVPLSIVLLYPAFAPELFKEGYRSMIQAVSRASRLALNDRRSIYAVNIAKLHPPPSYTRPRLLSSTTHIVSHTPKSRDLPYRSYIKQSIRSCSYRKTMCKANSEIDSSIDVTKSREVLPTNVKPLHYDLTLEPDFEKFSYEGTVVIE